MVGAVLAFNLSSAIGVGWTVGEQTTQGRRFALIALPGHAARQEADPGCRGTIPHTSCCWARQNILALTPSARRSCPGMKATESPMAGHRVLATVAETPRKVLSTPRLTPHTCCRPTKAIPQS